MEMAASLRNGQKGPTGVNANRADLVWIGAVAADLLVGMIEKDEVDANKDSPTKSLGACRNFILAVAFYKRPE